MSDDIYFDMDFEQWKSENKTIWKNFIKFTREKYNAKGYELIGGKFVIEELENYHIKLTTINGFLYDDHRIKAYHKDDYLLFKLTFS